jgi:hypothetical protein
MMTATEVVRKEIFLPHFHILVLMPNGTNLETISLLEPKKDLKPLAKCSAI